MAKTPAWERGPKSQSSGRGVIALRKQPVCLRSLTVGRRVRSAHRVTSDGQKTGFANRIFSVQRPFPVCESMFRTTWVQGLSRTATRIKVDVEHPARMSDPAGLLL